MMQGIEQILYYLSGIPRLTGRVGAPGRTIRIGCRAKALQPIK